MEQALYNFVVINEKLLEKIRSSIEYDIVIEVLMNYHNIGTTFYKLNVIMASID